MDFEKIVLANFRSYLSENRVWVEKQQSIIEQILDEKFDLVYDFFYSILASPKQYKILRARRCQVLFYIFMPIILLNEEDLEPSGVFISHNSMIKYKDSIINTSALIADDVLIHGRGLKQIYEILDRDYQHENITTFVLYKSKEAEQRDERFWVRVRYEKEVFDWEWVALSCQLVNVIYASTSPYISFVGSYVKYGIEKNNEHENSFAVIDNTNSVQKEQGEGVFVLYEKDELLPLFSKLSYDCCLRIYKNEQIEKSTYIPYIFLKNFDVETNKNLFQWICSNIDSEKTVFIRKDLLRNFECKEGIEYQTRLFAALINQVYGLYLQKKYNNVLNGAVVDCAALSIIYGTEIAGELCHITYEDVQSVLTKTMPFAVNEKVVEEDFELKQIWNKINNESRNSGIEKLSLYFYKNRMIDEKRASEFLDRKRGLTVGYFYNTTSAENCHEMSSWQLGEWDSGIASCCVHQADDQSIAFYNAAGEQSFRYVLDKFSEIMDELIFLYNKPLFDSSEKSGVELVQKRMEELRNDEQERKKYGEEEWKALEIFIEKNIYRLGAWRI